MWCGVCVVVVVCAVVVVRVCLYGGGDSETAYLVCGTTKRCGHKKHGNTRDFGRTLFVVSVLLLLLLLRLLVVVFVLLVVVAFVLLMPLLLVYASGRGDSVAAYQSHAHHAASSIRGRRKWRGGWRRRGRGRKGQVPLPESLCRGASKCLCRAEP